MTLGKGKAAAITDADMAKLADDLQCHPADLEAIAQVESNGFGWFADGRIKILFEKHWFYKLIPDEKRTNAMKSGLARKSWISPAKGGYKDQAGPDDRYKLLERAIKVDREAAFSSVSVGKFQIMGFNHKICGHQTAEGMFNAFCESEVYQLSAFAGFLVNKGLVKAIRARDFDAVEKGYNGGGLNGAYARKMKAASGRLRAGKWKDYRPGSKSNLGITPKPSEPSVLEPKTPDLGIASSAKIEQGPVPSGNWLSALIAALAKLLKGN